METQDRVNCDAWSGQIIQGKSNCELYGTGAKTALLSYVQAFQKGKFSFTTDTFYEAAFFTLTWRPLYLDRLFLRKPLYINEKYDLNIFFSGGLSSFLKQDFSLPFTSGCLENKIYYSF